MADPNMSDFYRRVARIQTARAKGQGFEAPGTLGRSFYTRPQAPRRSVVAPVLLLLMAVFLLKGVMITQIGTEEYAARVERLQHGQGVEPFGGWLMQIDPVSAWVAVKIAPWLPQMH